MGDLVYIGHNVVNHGFEVLRGNLTLPSGSTAKINATGDITIDPTAANDVIISGSTLTVVGAFDPGKVKQLKQETWAGNAVTIKEIAEIISEYLYNTLKRKQSILRDNDKSVVQFIQQEIDMIPLDLRKKGDKHNAT